MLGGPGLDTRRQRVSLGLHSVDTGCRHRSASAKGVLCVVDMCVCVGASKGRVYEKEHRRSRIMLAHAARDWSHTLQWHQAHTPRVRRGVGVRVRARHGAGPPKPTAVQQHHTVPQP